MYFLRGLTQRLAPFRNSQSYNGKPLYGIWNDVSFLCLGSETRVMSRYPIVQRHAPVLHEATCDHSPRLQCVRADVAIARPNMLYADIISLLVQGLPD